MILMSFATAVGISILYLVLIRIFAGLIVWITCLVWFTFTLGGGLCLYYDIGIEEYPYLSILLNRALLLFQFFFFDFY